MKKYLILLFILIFSFVNVSALTLTVDIPDKYAKVSAGERFFFTLVVKYPENPSRIDLRLNYEVRNEYGDLVAQSKVLKAVQTQASFIDSIILPENLESGFHTIDILVTDYGNLDEKVGSSFQITGKKSDQITMYFYIIMGSVGLLILLILYDLFIRKRN
jgi:hypothetical protein